MQPHCVIAHKLIGFGFSDGILRNVEASAQNTEIDLNDALKDLEALMMKAKDLVHLAAELNEKLTASSTTTTTSTTVSSFSAPETQSSNLFSTTTLVPSTEPDEAKFIRSSLVQLGLQMPNAPVTLDMIRDERKWIEELARELAGILQGSPDDIPGQKSVVGIMKDRGIVRLDEVWGGWNRARGVGKKNFFTLPKRGLNTFVRSINSANYISTGNPPPSGIHITAHPQQSVQIRLVRPSHATIHTRLVYVACGRLPCHVWNNDNQPDRPGREYHNRPCG